MDFKANRRIRGVLFCVACLGALVASTLSCEVPRKLRTLDVSIETAAGSAVPLRVELAITDREQEKGYMGRKTIPDGTGMVFAYDYDLILRFWMKNTPHPLSIAYISSDGTIRDIIDMEPFDLTAIESSRSVRFALEVPQGWFARAGIAVGDRLSADSVSRIAKLVRETDRKKN